MTLVCCLTWHMFVNVQTFASIKRGEQWVKWWWSQIAMMVSRNNIVVAHLFWALLFFLLYFYVGKIFFVTSSVELLAWENAFSKKGSFNKSITNLFRMHLWCEKFFFVLLRFSAYATLCSFINGDDDDDDYAWKPINKKIVTRYKVIWYTRIKSI